MLAAKHFLMSTNGSIYEHPDEEAIARILTHDPKDKNLHFNYPNPTDNRWADEEAEHGYTAY